MPESMSEFLLKVAATIAMAATTNIYVGAIGIACISSISRVAFEAGTTAIKDNPLNCISKIGRYFILSLALAMLFVHVGIWQAWSKDMTIVVASIFAFMSEETIRFILSSWNTILVKASARVLK